MDNRKARYSKTIEATCNFANKYPVHLISNASL